MAVDFSKLKKLIHRKSPEIVAPLAAGNTAAGGFFVADKGDAVPGHDSAFYVGGVSAIWRYNGDEDAWMQVPNSGIAGTFAAGSCGEYRALSMPGGNSQNTATAGTTTTLTTALNLASNLRGVKIRVVAGAGAGYEGTISYNVTGANSVITVTPASGVAFGATSVFQIFAGALWFFNAGTVAVGLAVYDLATNAWTQKSVTGLPTAWGTDAQLLSTGSQLGNDGLGFSNGTASAGAASTLTDGAKSWPVNGWTNYQVRIKSGTGAGQVRTIASNTATVLTTSAAWTTNPDATSVYVIEGNDDFMYLLGNNAVTMYRYSLSGNSWSTLAPTAARAGALATGGMADWIDGVPGWQEASVGVYGAHYLATIIRQNGRYIYSFRGGASNILDVYDIAGNTWISGVAYGNQMETFTTGSCSADIGGLIFIQKEATGRIYRFDVEKHRLDPLFLSPMPQGAAVVGDKMVVMTYKDTGVGRWLYTLGHTRSELIRFFLV